MEEDNKGAYTGAHAVNVHSETWALDIFIGTQKQCQNALFILINSLKTSMCWFSLDDFNMVTLDEAEYIE